MLEILRAELDKYHAFDAPSHPFVDSIVRAIPFTTVPEKMKVVFAISHVSQYASQFRRNTKLWDGTEVPTNNISFVVAASGANKDSSNSKVKACFKEGYKAIQAELEVFVRDEAIKAAQKAEEELPEEYAIYSKYMKPIPPPFMAMSTGPGLVQHINDIGALPLGAGMQYVGELSDELLGNPNAVENLKVLAECFDLGNKEVSYTKGTEFRSKEISGQPVSALMVGSPGYILYDEGTRKKFHVTFMSKMARRSWFCYAPERIEEPDFSDSPDAVNQMLQYEAEIDQVSKAAAKVAQGAVKTLTEHNLKRKGEPIPTSAKVFELFNIYKRYNSEVVNKANAHESVYSLVRSHLQWKALKFAGALAVIEGTDEVTVEQYITAIRYCEMFDSDITMFERDMNKVPHESLSDYLRSKVEANNKSFISIHDIKKLGFSASVTHPKLLELVSLCAGYDRNGIYSIADNASGILYEPVRLSEVVGVSIKDIDNSRLHKAIAAGATHDELSVVKNRIAAVANTGYGYVETSFEELGELLKEDYAYSPFQFVNGERHKDNLIGGTKWLVIDVDTTTLSAGDAHFLLEGINHHIALTSDPNNEYKYRVLIELDSYVELSAVAWKHFYSAIAADLGLDADILPQSQIYFSYAGRKVWSYTEGTSIECRDYIMAAKEKETSGVEKAKTLSKGQMSQLLTDPLSTFWYAFDCVKGRRSTTLYRAARHAKDLGASLEETVDLLEQINNYLTDPLGEERYTKLVEQIVRLYRSNLND